MVWRGEGTVHYQQPSEPKLAIATKRQVSAEAKKKADGMRLNGVEWSRARDQVSFSNSDSKCQ